MRRIQPMIESVDAHGFTHSEAQKANFWVFLAWNNCLYNFPETSIQVLYIAISPINSIKGTNAYYPIAVSKVGTIWSHLVKHPFPWTGSDDLEQRGD